MLIQLINLYYSQNKEIPEYRDIFIETNYGFLKVFVTHLAFREVSDIKSMERLDEIDYLKDKYGDLFIQEIRKTYDNDIYLLISGKFILAIEYVLNSNFKNSVQEFRIIEDIHNTNNDELNSFNELELVELPLKS
jgi:hypothetical protein